MPQLDKYIFYEYTLYIIYVYILFKIFVWKNFIPKIHQILKYRILKINKLKYNTKYIIKVQKSFDYYKILFLWKYVLINVTYLNKMINLYTSNFINNLFVYYKFIKLFCNKKNYLIGYSFNLLNKKELLRLK